MPAAASSQPRTAPLALWRVVQAFLGTLHMLFGDPTAVAARHTLTGAAHALMASWLRCAEAMVRRLLLIEASAIAKPNTRPLLHDAKRMRRKRACKLMAFYPEHPEAWRVSFRTFESPRQPRQRAVRFGPPKPRRRISREDRWSYENFKRVTFRSAWPLAERYEALIRVFNDPAAYARRLARRMHATPHRLREALRAPPEAVHRVDRFSELSECASEAWRPLISSA